MVVIPAGTAQRFSLEGNHIAGVANPRRGAPQVEVWHCRVDAGSATPPHRHDHEEVVVVVSGRGRARLGDEELSWGPGDTLILPADRLHQLFADTDAVYVAVMPAASRISDASGAPLDLPWRA